ncbi:MAG: flagellar basal body P-ring protein FlgI, partial [bacterium]|nr:flagellar basal body P-ring protein FlgI [bacterium]
VKAMQLPAKAFFSASLSSNVRPGKAAAMATGTAGSTNAPGKITRARLAKIIINERTGTIVMGKSVRISPVTILHGALTVEVRTSLAVSQPQGFSEGETVVVPEVGVGVSEEQARNLVLDSDATVEDLAKALLAIGSTPRDVIAILQNLRAAGALEAGVEVI